MQCIYINLHTAVARREAIEASFERYAHPEWRLSRFDAVDKEFVARNSIKGSCSASQKACFLSHMLALQSNLDDMEHLLILEDDALLGESTAPFIVGVLNNEAIENWDLIFTTVSFTNPSDILDLMDIKQELRSSGAVSLQDLKGKKFVSTQGYIVNGRSKKKLFNIMSAFTDIFLPIDEFFCQCIQSSAISGAVIFPFVIRNSFLGEQSQIRVSSNERDLLELSFLLSRSAGSADAPEAEWRGYMNEIERLIGGERCAIGSVWASLRLALRVAAGKTGDRKVIS